MSGRAGCGYVEVHEGCRRLEVYLDVEDVKQ